MNRIFLFVFLLFSTIGTAMAHCPLCTGAVGAAAVSAKYFGLDSSIIGVFVGAFAVSTGMMFKSRTKKYTPLVVLASFLLTMIPISKVVADYKLLFIFNEPYFINKLIFGGVFGGIAVPSSYILHKKVKAKRGKVLFPYQGVAFTLLSLAIISTIMYMVI